MNMSPSLIALAPLQVTATGLVSLYMRKEIFVITNNMKIAVTGYTRKKKESTSLVSWPQFAIVF